MSLIKFIGKAARSKTVHGIVVAALGTDIVPAVLNNAPAILTALHVSGGTAGKIVTIAGLVYSLYGRSVASGPLIDKG